VQLHERRKVPPAGRAIVLVEDPYDPRAVTPAGRGAAALRPTPPGGAGRSRG
jgi:hypothetical protein